MADDKDNEAPIDLLQSGRDELIDGTGVQIAPQPEDSDSVLDAPEPHPGHRCAPEQCELESQSAILRRSEVEKLMAKKPH